MPEYRYPTAGYAITIPSVSAAGMPVAIAERSRDAMQQIHAETADQSTLYVEVTAYPLEQKVAALVASQRAFLEASAVDCQLTPVQESSVLDQPAKTFDFCGILQGRFKQRRFMLLRGPISVLRVVYDYTSAENTAVLTSMLLLEADSA